MRAIADTSRPEKAHGATFGPANSQVLHLQFRLSGLKDNILKEPLPQIDSPSPKV